MSATTAPVAAPPASTTGAGAATRFAPPSGASPATTERAAYRRNGIAPPPDPTWSIAERVLRRPLTWVFVATVLLSAASLAILYWQVVPDKQVPGGTSLGISLTWLPTAARYATYTVVPLTAVLLLLDRLRPQPVLVWIGTFLWGACVATMAGAFINSWAAEHLNISGDGDPTAAARPAIFVAPFVEEACKATALFWVAILMRYRLVSRVGVVTLGGLAGAGFAYVENMIYYGRLARLAQHTAGVEDPAVLVKELFVLRGVLTCFGHPLFTAFTALGLAVAIRHRSKIVRIVAPLAGFLAASFAHMAFNTVASLVQPGLMRQVLYIGALGVLFGVVLFLVRSLFLQGRTIALRLSDYVRMGWLPESDLRPLSRMRTRLRARWQGLWLGPRTAWATYLLQRYATELAYLRDAEVRGIVDEGGRYRERELLSRIAALRPRAVVQPTARADYAVIGRALRRVRPARFAPPSGTPAMPAGPASFPPPSFPPPSFPPPSFPPPAGPPRG